MAANMISQRLANRQRVAPLPFQSFQSFNRCAPFKTFLGRYHLPPTRLRASSLSSPATAGEDKGGGLNCLNDLNQSRVIYSFAGRTRLRSMRAIELNSKPVKCGFKRVLSATQKSGMIGKSVSQRIFCAWS